MDKRDSLDFSFMEVAYLISKRAVCIKRKVGSVIVGKNKSILSTGYNGAPSGVEHCTEKTCLRINIPSGQQLDNCLGAHSEANAIAQAAKNGVKIEGATLYCTTQPCTYCSKIIASSGISKVVFSEYYGEKKKLDDLTKKLLKNVEIYHMNMKTKEMTRI